MTTTDTDRAAVLERSTLLRDDGRTEEALALLTSANRRDRDPAIAREILSAVGDELSLR